MGWFGSIFLAACVTACTGLRAFLPLFIVTMVSREGLAGTFRIPEPLRWLESEHAILVLGGLALLEVLADKTPLVARLFEVPLVLLRPVAGVLACFSVLRLPTAGMNATAALALGLLFSQPLLRLKTSFRMIRWRQNRTFVHPVLSLAEDVLVGLSTLVAFFHPVPVLLALVGLAFWMLTRVRLDLFRRSQGLEDTGRSSRTPPPTGYGPRPETPSPPPRR